MPSRIKDPSKKSISGPNFIINIPVRFQIAVAREKLDAYMKACSYLKLRPSKYLKDRFLNDLGTDSIEELFSDKYSHQDLRDEKLKIKELLVKKVYVNSEITGWGQEEIDRVIDKYNKQKEKNEKK